MKTIIIAGYVKISTLNTAKNAKGNTAHQGALETIFQVVERNTNLNLQTAATVKNAINNGTFEGYKGAEGMDIRSCHGDSNLTVTISGTTYNSVEQINNAQFQTGAVEVIWWDYARNATTEHVANPLVDMAAFVEFNCTSFMHQAYLAKLQSQTKFHIGPANANPRIPINAGGTGVLPEADGPRLLWHVIGDFFVYSPDHYATGYVVMDDNNDLFQTKNFF